MRFVILSHLYTFKISGVHVKQSQFQNLKYGKMLPARQKLVEPSLKHLVLNDSEGCITQQLQSALLNNAFTP